MFIKGFILINTINIKEKNKMNHNQLGNENNEAFGYLNYSQTLGDFESELQSLQRIRRLEDRISQRRTKKSNSVSWGKMFGSKWLGYGFKITFHRKGVRLENTFMIALLKFSVRAG